MDIAAFEMHLHYFTRHKQYDRRVGPDPEVKITCGTSKGRRLSILKLIRDFMHNEHHQIKRGEGGRYKTRLGQTPYNGGSQAVKLKFFQETSKVGQEKICIPITVRR